MVLKLKGKVLNHFHSQVVECICQVMTQADLGLADAYINRDFSFIDKDKGLLNLFMVR